MRPVENMFAPQSNVPYSSDGFEDSDDVDLELQNPSLLDATEGQSEESGQSSSISMSFRMQRKRPASSLGMVIFFSCRAGTYCPPSLDTFPGSVRASKKTKQAPVLQRRGGGL